MLALPKKPRLASDSEGEEEEKGDGKKQTSLFSFFKRKPKKTEDCKSAEPESVSLSVSVLKAQADAEVSSEYRRMLPLLWGIREAPFNLSPPLFGHCPFGGGGSKPLPGWFGALF